MRRRGSFLGAAAPIWLAMALFSPASAEAAPPLLELREGGKAALLLENASPGSSARSCLRLTYRGSTAARVRLHGTTRGTGFDRYLELTVKRGASCRKGTIVYDGTLAGFPDSTSEAIEETWSPGESHAYGFEVTVRDDNEAQGLDAQQTFTWTAHGDVDLPVADGSNEALPLVQPAALGGFGKLLRRVAEVAAEVGKRSAFPGALLLMVFGFLMVQNRIDRKDPKLALAPVYPTPDLEFEPPGERSSE
jgi:hypothetical protein